MIQVSINCQSNTLTDVGLRHLTGLRARMRVGSGVVMGADSKVGYLITGFI